MNGVGAYILSVICAASICAIVMHFFETKGAIHGAVKLAAGLFLAFTVINPVVCWTGGGLLDVEGVFSSDASSAVEEGISMTKQSLSQIIKDRCEAYILDKAADMDLSLLVEVGLTDEDIPAPNSVKISGNISPYKKMKLQSILVNDLGIDKEDQIWT